jgi:hypothetical protein
MRRMTASMAVAALLLAAVPARAQVAVAFADARDFYSPEYVGYVASRGPIPTVIFGDPFGPAADPALVAMLPPPAFVANASFAPADAVQKQEFDRVVLSFDPVPGYQAYDLCARPDIPSVKPASGTSVIATLCRGRYVASQAMFTMPTLKSPEDPVVHELMSRVSATLFPSFIKPGHGSKGSGPPM